MHEDKPAVITTMLTRKCPYNCSYCLIKRKKSVDLPASYWIDVGLNLGKDIHFNFYGGEPQVYGDLSSLVSQLNGHNFNYSFNSACPSPAKLEKFARVNNLRNWTPSIDTLYDSRSLNGLETLKRLRKVGVPDLMAEIVVFPKMVSEAQKVVDFLIRENFWLSITFLSWGKSSNYDSFPRAKPNWSATDKKQISQLRRSIIDYPKLHGNLKSYLELWDCDEFLYQQLKPCNGSIVCFNPDSDGQMRLCRDIKGNLVTKWNALEASKNISAFFCDWIKDYESQCLGCSWACPFFAKDLQEQIRHEI